MATRKIKAEVEVESSGAVRALDRVRSAGEKVDSSFKRFAIGSIIGGTIASALSFLVKNADESVEANIRLDGALRRLGATAGVTSKQINELASSVQQTTKFSDESVKDAASSLLLFDKITGDTFTRALKVSTDLAAVMGTDVPAAATALGRALQMPGSGLRVLVQAGIKFNDTQVQTLQRLTETGRAAEAQAVILQELELRTKGAAEETTRSLGGALESLKNQLGDLLESDASIGALVNGVNGLANAVGRLSGERTKLDDLNNALKVSEESLGRSTGEGTKILQEHIKVLKEQIRTEQSRINLQGSGRAGRGSRGSPSLNIGGDFQRDIFHGMADVEEKTFKSMEGNRQRNLEEMKKNFDFIDDEWDRYIHDLRQVREAEARIYDARGVTLQNFETNMEEVMAHVEENAQELSDNLKFPFDEFTGAVKNSLENIVRTGKITGRDFVTNLIIELSQKRLFEAIDKIGNALSNALSASSGKGGFLGMAAGAFSLFSGAASGGYRSRPTIVGENGPELALPGRGGMTVLNRSQMGGLGGSTLNYSPSTNITVQGNMDSDAEERIYRYIERTRKEDQRGMVKVIERNLNTRLR